MQSIGKVPATLLLEDGTIFKGYSAGKIGTTTGEMCFNTGMTGYQEIFSDPSYYRQIMVTTNAHIGNYGCAQDDSESNRLQISGLVCKNYSLTYSRPKADSSLQSCLIDSQLVAISDVDTRALVLHLRKHGAMNGIISSENLSIEEMKEKLIEVPSMKGLDLSGFVSCQKPYLYRDNSEGILVAVIDYGIKNSILKQLNSRGLQLMVFPHTITAEEIISYHPKGILLSNGPGDPSVMDFQVGEISKLLEYSIPVMGICLGHQLLCRSMGLSTYKMHHGHRGINHPVKNLITGKSEITSQNHGFGVDLNSAINSDKVKVTHVNLNDNTLEGIQILGKPAFSVQYHPEAGPGPHDAHYLFDQFIQSLS